MAALPGGEISISGSGFAGRNHSRPVVHFGQAESLPGGWGIMADDWIAAVYAALGLWIARWLGL